VELSYIYIYIYIYIYMYVCVCVCVCVCILRKTICAWNGYKRFCLMKEIKLQRTMRRSYLLGWVNQSASVLMDSAVTYPVHDRKVNYSMNCQLCNSVHSFYSLIVWFNCLKFSVSSVRSYVTVLENSFLRRPEEIHICILALCLSVIYEIVY
jgi:hypothetical protein